MMSDGDGMEWMGRTVERRDKNSVTDEECNKNYAIME